MQFLLNLIEKGKVPDALLRGAIRLLLHKRLREMKKNFNFEAFCAELRSSPLAVQVEKANEQHYEVPFEFFEKVLGKRMKYSGCYWPTGILSLDEAEEQALTLVGKHAQLEDGQEILELGCGWGSLTLWMAEHFPRSTIIAVSNSASQKEFIDSQVRMRNLPNVQVYTCDINELKVDVQFDRIVSIEMFEHLRNYEELMHRLAQWLKPGGRAFVHVFCHAQYAYLFSEHGAANWMGRHFFSGGMMPSRGLLPSFASEFDSEHEWLLNGKHYAKTARAWMENLEKYKVQLLPILARAYGEGTQALWFQRWKIFFMACEELFAFRDGEEWLVAHYLFRKALANS